MAITSRRKKPLISNTAALCLPRSIGMPPWRRHKNPLRLVLVPQPSSNLLMVLRLQVSAVPSLFLLLFTPGCLPRPSPDKSGRSRVLCG